ncbi:hypothetical protein B0H10DRAFT_1965708 [Mycena sp. CBHHK59/15]|nr:hypothetical protein B0H10DRAFT_1965702 [Mycena sp. CBHHK59/15]KAJ6565383.1 hypothetical protein B0H10DRAFT_1965708 [Mycena sp. CBHHK59/15]
MTQLGIPLSQLASKDFQEVLRLSGALPTRWSPRQLNVHRWHLIKSTTIYPRLCEMVDLLKITEPELLDKLYVTPLAGYIFVGVHNSSSLYSVQDVTGGALRALTKKSAENAAQVATTMHTGCMSMHDALCNLHCGWGKWDELTVDDDDTIPDLIDEWGYTYT